MRTLLVMVSVIGFLPNLSAQSDFRTLDQRTYDFYIRGDYANLKRTADTMLAGGTDYYYLRMRLGITAFNKKLYSTAIKHFSRALEFNSLDTISQLYIYYSYVLSGREADAKLYLLSLAPVQKSHSLEAITKPGLKSVFGGYGISGSDMFLYSKNNLNYESIRNIFSFDAGLEAYLMKRLKATVVYSNFRKTGIRNSRLSTGGTDLNFSQHQVYSKVAVDVFPGWELSGFGHLVFYSDNIPSKTPPYDSISIQTRTEYITGAGLAKNFWKIRAGVNFSLSNFSDSNQERVEAYLAFLPSGNLNLYMTSGGMLQSDRNWGNTYQINEELGFKLYRNIWIESGIIFGNSFLYARNQGYFINNSYLIPHTTIYCNIIVSPGKRYMVTLSPYFCVNKNYSWDLNVYTRTNELNPKSYGISVKLNYNNK
jgi:hypothetical protein